MRRFAVAFAILLTLSAGAFSFRLVPTGRSVQTPRRTFTPLHTYYMSPTGSDSNNGLTTSTPWLTYNGNGHTINCGDIVYAMSGTYTSSANFASISTVPSNCPSTSGGLDGTGGIYFAQIICMTPFECFASSKGTGYPAVKFSANYWAIQGFVLSSANADGGCVGIEPGSATTIHHIAVVNTICNGAHANGFSSYPHSANHGSDYIVYIGDIAYNAAQGTDECYSGFSVYEPVIQDKNSGTHIFLAGNFSWGNAHAECGSGTIDSDGNGFILDDWGGVQIGQSAYTGTGVVRDNISWDNNGDGISIGGNGTTAATIKIYNNTAYGNSQGTIAPYGGDELFMGTVQGTGPVSISNNLFVSTNYTYKVTGHFGSTNGATAYNYTVQCYACTTAATVSGNYIFNSANTSYQEWSNRPGSPAFVFGSNTLSTSPGFASPPAHGAIGAPNCSSYATTTACMATVIADFAPSGGAIGLGYQKPSGTCNNAGDSDFPTWMKGIIPIGLITLPCGM
ncbi:MAG TPA: hypothetical protein VL996_05675 [Methylocella sp.]|nr:hypothetical protein [Methylocella sp.]